MFDDRNGNRARDPGERPIPGVVISNLRDVARTFSFIHASDTHIAPENVDRTRRLRQLVDSIRPDFTLFTGDLIRDAMSQQEPLSRANVLEVMAAMRGHRWVLALGGHMHAAAPAVIDNDSLGEPAHAPGQPARNPDWTAGSTCSRRIRVPSVLPVVKSLYRPERMVTTMSKPGRTKIRCCPFPTAVRASTRPRVVG
jgi:hypothetical protein